MNAETIGGVVRYSWDLTNNGAFYENNLMLDRGRVGINKIPTVELDVEGDTILNGDLTVTKNITGNYIYGECYGDDIGETIITDPNKYYNITNMTVGNLNGIHIVDTAMIIEVAGTYSFSSDMSLQGTANNEYHLALGINGERQLKCHAQAKVGTGTDKINLGYTCLINVEVDDALTSMVENTNAGNNIDVHDINLNLVRIGD